MVEFGLMFFANHDTEPTAGKYDLMLRAAEHADAGAYTAVWTPERHYHAFGGIFPNAALTSAAIAARTNRIRIRAGSVVVPLHHLPSLAEDWAVVDNLSNGRAEISLASGWSKSDFGLWPGNYHQRHSLVYEAVPLLRRLWDGQAMTVPGVDGQACEIRVYPQPVQGRHLPLWITSSASPATFEAAGKAGLNILTHLLGQNTAQLAEKISLYRHARIAHGMPPEAGRVAVMVHTYLEGTEQTAVGRAASALRAYLRTSADLDARERRATPVPAAALDQLIEVKYAQYMRSSVLIGSPSTCLPMVQQLTEAGADEIACLIDFGLPAEVVLGGLKHLDQLVSIHRSGLRAVD